MTSKLLIRRFLALGTREIFLLPSNIANDLASSIAYDYQFDAFNSFAGYMSGKDLTKEMYSEAAARFMEFYDLTRRVHTNVPPTAINSFLANKYGSKLEKAPKNPRYIPRSVMTEVWNRDNGKCVKCGSNQQIEFDHIKPVSLGGSSTANNVQ
jgi:hypothetical protein